MSAKLIAWFFNTPMGRGILIGLLLSLGAGISWWVFSSHYDKIGYERCQQERRDELNKANVEQANKNEQSNQTSSEVAKAADKKGEKARAEIATDTNTAKKEIEYVYRDRPATAPVALGSCVHPVDDRVQKRIDEALRRANEAGGPL